MAIYHASPDLLDPRRTIVPASVQDTPTTKVPKGAIAQKNASSGGNVRLIEEEGGESVEEGEGEGDVDKEDVDEGDENEDHDEPCWNDVFPEDAPRLEQSDSGNLADESAEGVGQVESALPLSFLRPDNW